MKKTLLIFSLFLFSFPLFSQAPSISYNSPQTYIVDTSIISLKPTNTGGAVPTTVFGQVTTLAGSGIVGAGDGAVSTASFATPYGVAVDAAGNVYVGDYRNNKIRKISPTGVVTTLAGSGVVGATDGLGSAASFNNPAGVAVDTAGNVYVADGSNNKIRKISPSGEVTTLAGSGVVGATDGVGTAASFYNPRGVAVDIAGNVYVADSNNFKIRKISPTGVVTTLAGSGTVGAIDGVGTAASFYYSYGVAVDVAGNVYVADGLNNKIRKISSTGVVTTLAGSGVVGATDGAGTASSFNYPIGVAVDAAGNVYVADGSNNKIRKISPTGVVTTLAGSGTVGATDGVGTAASFNGSIGVAVDVAGNVYVADATNNKIRKITITGYSISPATLPTGLSFDATTGIISGIPRAVSSATKYTVTAYNVVGTSTTVVNITCFLPPPSISYNSPQTYIIGTTVIPLKPTNTGGVVPTTVYGQAITLAGGGTSLANDGVGTAASFYYPRGVALDIAGNVYVADSENNKIRKISPTGVVTTLAGSGTAGAADGVGSAASFNYPAGVAVDVAGNVYVADASNKIRKISPSGEVTTLAGNGTSGDTDGVGKGAKFNFPTGVAVDAADNVYVADKYNNKIRKISPTGVVITLAGSGTFGATDGTGTATSFNYPEGIAVNAAGNVYVADKYNNKIRKISPTGVVTTLAGSGTAGAADGVGSAASFNNPTGVAVDVAGNVYVADASNKIRKISPSGEVTTLAGSGTAKATDGIGAAASFSLPYGLAVDVSGIVYVTELGSNLIKKIISTGYVISPTTLPAGLSFDVTTGTISGTPTIASSATSYTVTAYNAGGSSSATIVISTSIPLPSNAGVITGISNVCQGQNAAVYSVPAIANATSYKWTLPNGATGISTTNSISVNYGLSAVSGNITVSGVNSSGTGVASTFAINFVNCSLPSNNFQLEVINPTCQTKANGELKITGTASYNYTATMDGTNYTFTNNVLDIKNLAPKTYAICINVAALNNYNQCFEFTVKSPPGFTAKTSMDTKGNKTTANVNIESGTAPYTVEINGKTINVTFDNQLNISVQNGDLLEIKSSVACEGKIRELVSLSNELMVYPNPTSDFVELFIPNTFQKNFVTIQMVDNRGKSVINREFNVVDNSVIIPMVDLSDGLYIIQVQLETLKTIKIIKK